ncbi:kinase-like domain-containing protein [Dioszegia hungarica]|uniref:Kinase-like domain-containing protein n=1 Tax=Dioszegia hungarica TaxID=4972 RepID=A0AA38H2A3_9TREE|nr:kinase-like domain-containing protein [Dioszegia hungarica]KAI9632346.1 kinase-like domain-containing protein [Dioszegia hungarica]
MAFLNPSAEPFTPPKLDSTAVSDAVNELPPIDGAEGFSLNELFAALLPHHQLRFERGNVKVYKPKNRAHNISYVVIQGDGSVESRSRLRREVEFLKSDPLITRKHVKIIAEIVELETAPDHSHPSIRGHVAVLDDPGYPPVRMLRDDGRPLDAYQNLYEDRRLPEATVKSLMTQLLSGLEWIHSKGIIHREIQPKRLIVEDDENGDATLKLSDFGRAINASEVNERYLQGIPYYRPPDVHLGSISYGTEYDIWSAGCIYTEMLRGEPLFQSRRRHLIKQVIGVFDFRGSHQELERSRRLAALPWSVEDASWPWYTPKGYTDILGRFWNPTSAAFLNGFLQFDPEARVSATDALKSPYILKKPIQIAKPSAPHMKIEEEQQELEAPQTDSSPVMVDSDQDISLIGLDEAKEVDGITETLESLLGLC